MGFPGRRIYELVFDTDDLEGLEVRAHSTDVRTYLEILREPGFGSRAEDSDASLHRLADALVSWNLEDDAGQPIPATYEGLQSVDKPIAVAIVNAWSQMVAGITAPLAQRSTSGQTVADSPDLSELPMQPATGSLSTSPTPSGL